MPGAGQGVRPAGYAFFGIVVVDQIAVCAHHSKHHGLYPEITHSSPSIWHCLPLQIRPDAAVSSACSSLDIQNTVDLADLIGNTVQFFCSMDIKGHNDGGAALLAGTHVHGSNIDLLFCKYL